MDFSYINENGKLVSGSAATTHFIYTVMGGVENYNDFVGEIYIKNFIKEQSSVINSEIEKDAKKRRFKVV